MEVLVERDNKKIKVDFEGKVKDLLKKVKVNPAEVLVVINGELVTEEDKVKKNDKVKLLSVISGG